MRFELFLACDETFLGGRSSNKSFGKFPSVIPVRAVVNTKKSLRSFRATLTPPNSTVLFDFKSLILRSLVFFSLPTYLNNTKYPITGVTSPRLNVLDVILRPVILQPYTENNFYV